MILIALLQSQTELKDNKECAQTCVLSVLFVSFVFILIYFKTLANKQKSMYYRYVVIFIRTMNSLICMMWYSFLREICLKNSGIFQ